MRTGWTAWTFALAGFLLPYMFVYNTSLLFMGSGLAIIPAVFTSLIGIVCLGGGMIGYLLKKTSFQERIALLGAAFLLIKPGLATDIIGFLCVVLVVIFQLRAKF